MQAPKRLSIKFFVENPDVLDAEEFVPVFQRWIQEKAIDNELLIDVADYKHVHHGPGIMLIAHEGDYAYQANGGRVGLSYTLKHHNSATLGDVAQLVYRRLTHAVNLIQADKELNTVIFNTDTLEITLLDRLNYPNDPETTQAVAEGLSEVLSDVIGHTATISVIDNDDNREPLRFMLENLSSPVSSINI